MGDRKVPFSSSSNSPLNLDSSNNLESIKFPRWDTTSPLRLAEDKPIPSAVFKS